MVWHASAGGHGGEPDHGRTAGAGRLPAGVLQDGVRLPEPGTPRGTEAPLDLRIERGPPFMNFSFRICGADKSTSFSRGQSSNAKVAPVSLEALIVKRNRL